MAGYSAREVHPITMGKPAEEVRAMFDLSVRIFDGAMALLRAGGRALSLSDFAFQTGEGSPYRTSVVSYGTGLARDGLGTPPFQGRQVLFVEPIVRTEDGVAITFGATVVVTPDGGRRLGQRSLEMLGSHRSFLAPYLAQSPRGLRVPWSPLPSSP